MSKLLYGSMSNTYAWDFAKRLKLFNNSAVTMLYWCQWTQIHAHTERHMTGNGREMRDDGIALERKPQRLVKHPHLASLQPLREVIMHWC
jgi:hypothetical protein